MNNSEKIWEELWQCTQVAHQDNFSFDLCDPDSRGNRVGIVFRFFSSEQVDTFLHCPDERCDILLDAHEAMTKMLQGKPLYGDVNTLTNEIDWSFKK